VYRQFTDVETFAEEINKLMKKSRTGVYAGDKDSKKSDAEDGEDHLRIAVDGPSGAGKSTIAKKLAEKLGIQYVDTGAMYRAIGYKMLNKGVTEKDKKKIVKLLADTQVDWKNGKVILDGKSLGNKIRTPEVSEMASKCSAIKEVREKLVEEQRNIASRMSVVMDGRDIGTNVMPDAEVKIYLDAAPEERARRRYLELKEKGQDVTLEEVLKDINERDKRDMTRKINPLRKADDAHLIDSTGMSIEEVVEAACRIVEDR
jgi:cytidylate kinase